MSDQTDTITSGTDNAELVKAGAAGLAASTKGRARIIESKKEYKRVKARKEEKEIISENVME